MLKNLSRFFRKAEVPSDSEHSESPSAESAGQPLLEAWSSLEIDNHRVDVFDSVTGVDPAGCVLFLHGHGRVLLNENETFSRLFKEHNLVAICPDGDRSWWLDQVCEEFDPESSPLQWIMERLIPFIEERWNLRPPSIALLGVSMGGQGALQLSYRHAGRFPVVAAISPAVDFDQLYGHGTPLDQMFVSKEDARQATVVLNLHPLAWPRHQWYCCDPRDTDWFDGCARLGMKLSSSGILHERDLETSAGGHSWDYFNHMAATAVAHIAKGLRSYDSSSSS